jgi:hypothetical protein
MPRLLATTFLLALAACLGCGGSAQPKTAKAENIDVNLEGTWQSQVIIDETEAAKANADAVALIKSMKMQMTFTNDGKLKLVGETNGQPYEDENSWQIVDQSDNVLKINTVTSDGREKDQEFFFNDSNSFDMPVVLQATHVGAMRFTRVR